MNLYGFADGDPVNFADPFGLSAIGWGGLAASIGRYWRVIAGAIGIGRAVSRNATAVELADDLLASTRHFAGNAGSRIYEIGRQIGNLRVGQQRAVEAVERAVDRFAERGPTVAIDGVKYLTAGMGDTRTGVNALAVAADGSVTRAIVRDVGRGVWEVVRILGEIKATQ